MGYYITQTYPEDPVPPKETHKHTKCYWEPWQSRTPAGEGIKAFSFDSTNNTYNITMMSNKSLMNTIYKEQSQHGSAKKQQKALMVGQSKYNISQHLGQWLQPDAFMEEGEPNPHHTGPNSNPAKTANHGDTEGILEDNILQWARMNHLDCFHCKMFQHCFWKCESVWTLFDSFPHFRFSPWAPHFSWASKWCPILQEVLHGVGWCNTRGAHVASPSLW